MTTRNNYAQHSPAAFQAMLALEKAIVTSGLDKNLLDLVKIRASQMNGCLFCNDMHVKEAKIHGEKELRLYHLAFWHESPLFSEKEKAALEWTEKLTKFGSHGIEDGEFDKISSFFSQKEVADLTLAIGMINFWNRLGVAFRPAPGGMDKMMGLDKAGLE